MIQDEELLVEGERALGRYTVVILRYSESSGWSSSMMNLDAVVTNYRLVLRPHRKRYTPASLPERFIKEVYQATKGMYHCVAIRVHTGHILYLAMPTGQLIDLHDDLKAMKAPPPKFHFDDKVAKQDIERLITYFGREPLPSN